MNKFELSKKIDMVPSLRDKNQRKLLTKVAGQMVQIENSYYLGNIYTTTNRNWSALALLDKENLKPFIGFIDLGIDDDATGEEIDSKSAGLLIHCKEVDGDWYIGIYWCIEKRLRLVGVGEVNFEERAVNVCKGALAVHEEAASGLYEMFNKFSSIFMDLITEISCSNFVVEEYEPTTSKFKQTIPAIRREKYRKFGSRIIDVNESTQKSYPVNRAKVLDLVTGLWESTLTNPMTAANYRDELMKGVMFSGIESQVTDYTNYPKANIMQVPFKNFTVTFTQDLINGQQNMRLINCRSVENGLEVSIFVSTNYKGREKRHITLTDVFLLRPNYTHERIYLHTRDFIPTYRDKMREISPENLRLRLVEECKCIISCFLTAVNKYDVQKVTGRFRKVVGKDKVRKTPIPENVHMVLDMSKRRSYEITGRYHSCGYHVKEHDRIGHWRRKPHSNERIYIEGVRVNEGKGDLYGRVSKEYKL